MQQKGKTIIMKRIAFFQSNLKVGGIQRSLVNLLKSHILDEYEVDVYLFSKDVFYDISLLPSNITIKYLKPFPYWCRFVPYEVLKIVYSKLQLNKEYDYVVDFDSYQQDCSLYTISQKKSKKIMWIHSDMKREYVYNKKYRILYHFFSSKFCHYDEFVAVSEGVVEPFKEKSGQYRKKIRVIPNIIDSQEIINKSKVQIDVQIDQSKLNIACVGRIYVAKGYDLLLMDFEKAYMQRKDLRLYIIGDGPDAKKYKKWVQTHGLTDAVFFLGNQKNPFNLLSQMDAFCLESRYEGQGMVLLEAKVLGLQLIFPKRLEKYNVGIDGVEDVAEAFKQIKKEPHTFDDLKTYKELIASEYRSLFSE